MMLIIMDFTPSEAVRLLIQKTDKKFCYKQLLELGQLICSAGISDVFKPVKQGKELQKWITQHKYWTLKYYSALFDWVKVNIRLQSGTETKFKKIYKDLCSATHYIDIPQSAVLRYRNGYDCEYINNSELPIGIVTEEYRKYIDWKFKKGIENAEN